MNTTMNIIEVFRIVLYLPDQPPAPFTGELGYDRLDGTKKIGPSYAKSVVYI